ncbi:putative histone deacetylase 3-like [Scophthalmus maximus]|uniref:Putative histone deacetylase 3-like n=1 Tax=Scophthalmus maximus TaxID=52904 RepID=A0A2U9C9R5_SCOMX|nr:putative histone deacetylase 3-like [Scophthalmus maximus]KAF0039691.1 hypothetical protein F2P81_007926 [Scophthalmus maximus]
MNNRTSYFYDPDVGNFHYGEFGCRSERAYKRGPVLVLAGYMLTANNPEACVFISTFALQQLTLSRRFKRSYMLVFTAAHSYTDSYMFALAVEAQLSSVTTCQQ